MLKLANPMYMENSHRTVTTERRENSDVSPMTVPAIRLEAILD